MKKENTIEEKQNVVVFVYRKKVFFSEYLDDKNHLHTNRHRKTHAHDGENIQ